MEKRFGDMMIKNSQRRYLPKSLTEEILEHKQKLNEHRVREAIGDESAADAPDASDNGGEKQEEEPAAPQLYGYAQIREAITERLGGPFDYTGF